MAAPSMRDLSSRSMGAVGALVRTSANCWSVATCLGLTKRKASASRTKLVQSEKSVVLRRDSYDAAKSLSAEHTRGKAVRRSHNASLFHVRGQRGATHGAPRINREAVSYKSYMCAHLLLLPYTVLTSIPHAEYINLSCDASCLLLLRL